MATRTSKRGTAIERLAALRDAEREADERHTASGETDPSPVDTATESLPADTVPDDPGTVPDGTIGLDPITPQEDTVTTTEQNTDNAPADEFIDVDLPVGTGKFNPYEAPLKATYESGKGKGKIVPLDQVDDAKRAIRKASATLGIGARIRVQDKGDGTALVAFLGQERKTRST